MKLAPGTVIDDKFEIIAPIGEGGMGFVYVALQRGLDREVAIKFLRVEEALDAEQSARFEREAQALSQLRHKYIVSVYAFGFCGTVPYLVMELVRGQSLQSRLDNPKGLPWKLALTYLSQISEAVECAHTNGIIHRDIKPSNILICDDGSIRLIDFGFAKLLDPSGSKKQYLTEAGVAIGSVLYMSPEQCIGEQCDARSDIYSLGCLFFHAITGHPPFDGEHTVVIMHQHVYERVRTLEEALPNVSFPVGLQNILSNALAKKREDRYQRVGELISDVDAILQGEGVDLRALPTIPSSPTPPKTKDRRKLLIGLASVAAATVAIMMTITLMTIKDPAIEQQSLRKEIKLLDQRVEREDPGNWIDGWPSYEKVLAHSVEKHLKLYAIVPPEEKDVERRRTLEILKLASFRTRNPYASAKYMAQVLALTPPRSFERASTYNAACNKWANAGFAALERNDLPFAKDALNELHSIKDEWQNNVRDEFEAPWQGQYKYLSLYAAILLHEGKHAQALKICQRADALMTNQENGRIRHAFTLSQLANAYLASGMKEEARTTAQRAFNICDNEIDSNTRTRLQEFPHSLDSIARLFIALGGPYDKARKLLEHRELAPPESSFHFHFDRARNTSDFALIAEGERDYKKAIELWSEAGRHFVEANKFHSGATCMLQKARLLEKSDPAKAARNRARAQEWFEKSKTTHSPDGQD